MSTLRAMTQAYYAPQNFGHFGLSLQAYAHFTSPIRRYADLIVHRALITAHGWGEDGLSGPEIEDLDATAQHISDTERRSMVAERDTNDRYLAAFLSERLGEEFTGKISGIARFGVFVKLDETGADGLVPMRALGREYFHFDRERGTLMGADTGRIISLGQRVTVRLAEAAPVSGGLAFDLIDIEGTHVAKGPSRRMANRPGARSARRGAKRPSSSARPRASRADPGRHRRSPAGGVRIAFDRGRIALCSGHEFGQAETGDAGGTGGDFGRAARIGRGGRGIGDGIFAPAIAPRLGPW